MPTIVVRELDTGRVIHRGWYHQLRDVWEPTAEVVAAWFKRSPDDVSCGESDDGDTIEVHGKAVATVEYVYRRSELRRPILEAAE